MLEKLLLEHLPIVTTPISLLAFIAAGVVLIHARTVGRAEKLIRSAQPIDRATLVAGALEILDVRSDKLSREQRFELALEILEQRRHRNMLVFSLCLIFGLIFAGLTAYDFSRTDLDRNIRSVLSTENREKAMSEFARKGIFDAKDEAIVDYLAKAATLNIDRYSMSESEYNRAAQKLYDSIDSVKKLRARAFAREEPFTVIGDVATATVPDRVDHPLQYFVHVPINSKFANRPVRITSTATNKYIRVFARGSIDPTHSTEGLHLNREQATFLANAFPLSGRLNVIIRETVEPIYDPNCSIEGRAKQFQPRADELCKQEGSVSLSYLQNVLAK